MKRIWSILAALALALSLSACGSDSGSDSKPASAPPSAASQGTDTSKAEPSEPPAPEPEPELEGRGSLGDYEVEIKGAALTKDYEGKPVIVVTYAWTNNSDKTTSAMVAVSEKAFQDGVSLETAIVLSDDAYKSGTSMTEVRPGTTIDVQCAFLLSSETSTVEFELSELLSFSSDVVSMAFDPSSL